MLNNWHKKEKPFAGFAGFGGGATGLGFGGDNPLVATGGRMERIGGYIHHYFPLNYY